MVLGSIKEIGYFRAISEKYGFVIEETDTETLDSMTIGSSHGGIIAIASERSFPALSDLTPKKTGFYIMIEGIEDPYNFGNAIRSLYASGASGIIVGARNWLGVAGTVARASAGASELLPAYVCDDPRNAVEIFKHSGYKTVCAGIRDSVSIMESDLKKPVLIVLGGEKRGISRALLDKATQIVRIDYGTDFAGSLSSAASCAIFAYEAMRQNKS